MTNVMFMCPHCGAQADWVDGYLDGWQRRFCSDLCRVSMAKEDGYVLPEDPKQQQMGIDDVPRRYVSDNIDMQRPADW